VAAAADGALRAFVVLSGLPPASLSNGAALLGQRARLMGLSRHGQISPGGSCRLLAARNGFVAVNLPRMEDWAVVPAWLESDTPCEWSLLCARAAKIEGSTLVDRGRLVGLAIAHADTPSKASWCTIQNAGDPLLRHRRPLVIDLSSLWAGPLCGALLGMAGADVVKVESIGRPDGARLGHPGFFDFLNAEKKAVAVDLARSEGRQALVRLVRAADIVIESTRPRALRQLGIVAEETLAEKPGMVWVSLTGHGRDGEPGNWAGFGDDAAVAGGLSAVMASAYGQMIFAGDAIGDPLAGLHAAAAAWASWRRGGGQILSVTLAGTVARAASFGASTCEDMAEKADRWTRIVAETPMQAYALPAQRQRARPFGADTVAVLQDLTIRC
jgi:hypothetical protein